MLPLHHGPVFTPTHIFFGGLATAMMICRLIFQRSTADQQFITSEKVNDRSVRPSDSTGVLFGRPFRSVLVQLSTNKKTCSGVLSYKPEQVMVSV